MQRTPASDPRARTRCPCVGFAPKSIRDGIEALVTAEAVEEWR